MVPLIWAVAGLALILAEFIVPEFVIFFFGMGALLNSLVLALVPALGDNVLLQIVIWLGFSALSLFGLRRYLSRWFKGRRFEEDDKAEFIGKKARVLEEITPEKPGRIRFGGTSWTAYSYDETFAKGDTVEIIRREGTRFLVTGSITGLPDSTTNEDSE